MASNFSEPSSPTSSISSSIGDWVVLLFGKNRNDIDVYIEKRIPRSNAYQTNHDVDCHFCKVQEHQIKRQYRKCKEGEECPVIYRIDHCSIKDIGRIQQNNDHSHELADSYHNENGLCDEIKAAIVKILEFNPTKFPKQIQVQLTTEKEKFGLQNIPIPELKKIQGFVHRTRNKIKPQSNKVEDVVNFIMSNLIFATIHENTPFFLN